MRARKIADWQAWYSLEPRDDDRADIHAAMLALMFGGREDDTLFDMLRRLRDHWTPQTPEEKKRRKTEKRKKALRRIASHGHSLRQEQEEKVKRRGNKHRKTLGSGNS